MKRNHHPGTGRTGPGADPGRLRIPDDRAKIADLLRTGGAAPQVDPKGRSLETLSRSLRALLGVIRSSGETRAAGEERALGTSAGGRQARLEEALSGLRGSIEALTGVLNATRTHRGLTPIPRLRDVEQRLAELSGRLLAGPRSSR